MARTAKKGKCSTCRVCRAYLREADRNRIRKAAISIEGKKPASTPLAEKVDMTGLPSAEKLLQTEAEICGCPPD